MAAVNWGASWDAACLEKSLQSDERRFDSTVNLLKATISADFHIHSALAAGTAVHDTRASAGYAFALLARGKPDDIKRATAILRELTGDQDADPASPTFGLWGYYHEEPARQMKPPDYNWADFIGTQLLIILQRDAAHLDADLAARLRTAVERAAGCSVKRNVSMGYTNIAVMSTFLIVGAAELLGTDALKSAAAARIAAFMAAFDASGSFPEYNSPTYNRVALENLTRMRMYWKDAGHREIAERLERRLWQHVLHHWHAPTRQFGGPMSRCYTTDLRRDGGTQIFLQKATGGRLAFYAEPSALPASAEVAMLDLRCPDDRVEDFMTPRPQTKTYRERYELSARPNIRSAQGSVWKTDRYLLGTINRLDMWNQRRDLVVRWSAPGDSGPNPPGRTAVIRFLKDGYDFSSAAVVMAQEKGDVLGAVTFAKNAGDKHVSLDRLTQGSFAASDLRFSLELTGLPAAQTPKAFDSERGVTLDLGGGLTLRWAVGQTLWGDGPLQKSEVRHDVKTGAVGLDVVVYHGAAKTFRWDEIRRAYLVFALSLGEGREPLGPVLVRTSANPGGGSLLTVDWDSPSGRSLAVTTRADMPEAGDIFAAAVDKIDGVIVPISQPPFEAV